MVHEIKPEHLHLYTVLKNVSGRSGHFGFLPPRGKTLAADEEVFVFGDIWDHIQDRAGGERYKQALLNLLTTGVLEIVRTPAVSLLDLTSGETGNLALNDGTLGTVDPSWKPGE